MPKLTNALINKISLVARPANRRPFHLMKHEKDSPMASAAATAEDVLNALPDEVQSAVAALRLEKSADSAEARGALGAIATIAHSFPQLSVEALAAAVDAARVSKASDKDEDEEQDEEQDEAEDDADDASTDKSKAKKQGVPPEFMREQKKKSQGGHVVDIEKAERERVMKAMQDELSKLRVDFKKSQSELTAERDLRVLKSIKDEVAREFRHLVIDGEQLAPVLKSMRDGAHKKSADALMAVLKSADEQLKMGHQQGGVFGVIGKSGGNASAGSAWSRIQEGAASIAKSTGCSLPAAIAKFADTPEGRELSRQHESEEN